jgi:hypothetical protein
MKSNPQFSALPLIVQEYIEHIVHKMRYRRSVRQEVYDELTAHFFDALRDCTDPTLRQQRAETLLADFGDAALLAQLIRRGKIRCRPWWRTAVVRSLQGTAALFILFIFYIVWFTLGRPTVRVDYLQMLNDRARPQVTDADNAWPLYEKAIGLIVKPSEEPDPITGKKPSEELSEISGRLATLSQKEQKLIREWVTANRPAWDQAVLATAKPYCYRAYTMADNLDKPILLAVLLPHIGGLRNLSRVGQRLAQIQIADGQPDKAIATALAMIREGKHWMGQVTLIEYLVGAAIISAGQEELLQVLTSFPQSGEPLAKIRGELATLWAGGFAKVSFEWERTTFLDIVQNIFTEGGPGGGHIAPRAMVPLDEIMGPMPIPVSASMALIHARRNETVARGNEIYKAMDQSVAYTPWQRKTQNLQPAVDLVNKLPKYRFALLQSLVPALTKVIDRYYWGKTTTEAVQTIVAILEFKAEKQRWPDSLAELKSAGLIPAVPMDPYGDGPLVYRKEGESFTLYSRGCDFEDDGGKAFANDPWGENAANKNGPGGPDGDRVFWPVN